MSEYAFLNKVSLHSFLPFVVLGAEPWALHMLGNFPAIELHP